MATEITLDGASGEGGGQILRTALTLSMLTGRPFHLTRIRARRAKPGLMPQHLEAVRSAAIICRGQIQGDRPGGAELRFHPGPINPGTYAFDIGTAGSTALLAQTLVPALALQRRPSQLTLTGGTHVPKSPCYHYLAWQWQPYLERIGLHVNIAMARAGFYPRGGGVLSIRVDPPRGLRSLALTNRGALVGISGISAVANLPDHIARRQRLAAQGQLTGYGPLRIVEQRLEAYGQGTVIALLARFAGGSGCHFALGAPGKRADAVGAEAAQELRRYIAGAAAVDRYLADQLLLPLALVPGRSTYTAERITNHLLTNAMVIRSFLPQAAISVEQLPNGHARVEVAGTAWAG
jgi:RNA 3'-terminal phosphate cyclase (ATP)